MDEPTNNEALPWEEKDGIKKPDEKVDLSPPHHSEAPASLTVKIKSQAGFTYMWTLRDDHNSNLFFKLKAMEKKWLEQGFTPVEERSFGGTRAAPPPKDYIPNRACPKCGSRLVSSTTKAGAAMIKCETNKWNPMLKRAEGCDFVEWKDQYQNN